MDPLLSTLQLGLIGVLATLALRIDRKPARVTALVVDGRTVDGSRIVTARAYVNGRAGLLNHAALAPRTGLFLEGSRAVHTRGMLFALDLVFLDRDGKVLAVKEDVPPGVARVAGPKGTRAVLEVGAFAAAGEFGITVGGVVRK